MAYSTTPCQSEEPRKITFSDPWRTLQIALRRLVVFFTFTEEDRVRAGIHIGRKGPEG